MLLANLGEDFRKPSVCSVSPCLRVCHHGVHDIEQRVVPHHRKRGRDQARAAKLRRVKDNPPYLRISLSNRRMLLANLGEDFRKPSLYSVSPCLSVSHHGIQDIQQRVVPHHRREVEIRPGLPNCGVLRITRPTSGYPYRTAGCCWPTSAKTETQRLLCVSVPQCESSRHTRHPAKSGTPPPEERSSRPGCQTAAC